MKIKLLLERLVSGASRIAGRPRRGNLLVVVTYAFVMSIVMVSLVQLSQALSTSAKDSAAIYSDIQDYRSSAELACFAYVSDLESKVAVKDMSSDWLGSTAQTLYLQALDAMVESISDSTYTGTGSRWAVSSMTDALAGIPLSDPSVVTELLGKYVNARQSFSLIVPAPLEVESIDDITDTSARMKLKTFVVDVDFSVKGETIKEEFWVSGLYLDILYSTHATIGGGYSYIVTLSFSEQEEGVEIHRVY